MNNMIADLALLLILLASAGGILFIVWFVKNVRETIREML